MSTFHGGPLDGVALVLRRSPPLLRAVYCSRRDEFDALDLLDDQVAKSETPYAYHRVGEPVVMMMDWTEGGRRRGGRVSSAEYCFIDSQPPEPVMRDNQSWQAWCRQWQAKSRIPSPGTASPAAITSNDEGRSP